MIETDPLSLMFIACFLVGLLFLLITSFMGHGHGLQHGGHVHVGHAALPHAGAGHHVATHGAAHTGHSHGTNQHGQHSNGFSLLAYLNPMTVVLFLVGFGFFGYIFHTSTPFGLPLLLALAGLSGLIIAMLFLALLSRLFGDSEGATVQDVADRTGLLGKVSITIQENSMGEIIYVSPGGMRKSIPARSVDGQRLERGQEVVVVNYQRGVAEVDTWEHFVNQEESGIIEAPGTDELATLRALLEEPNKTDTEYVMRQDSQKE